MRDVRSSGSGDVLQLTEEMRIATGVAAPDKARSNKHPPPFSIRFTDEERAKLDAEAAGMPLSTYIRQKLFDGELSPRRTRGRFPVKDHEALGRALGLLGGSRLASNLNQLSKAAHIGALPVTPELIEELRTACAHVREMRSALLRALGHPELEGET